MFDEIQNDQPSLLGPIVVGVLLVGAGVGVWQYGGFGDGTTPAPSGNLPEPTAVERSVAAMIAQPRFYGTRLTDQLLGEIELDVYQMKDQELYLTLDRNGRTDEALRNARAAHLDDPDAIDVAVEESEGTLALGERTRYGRPSEIFWFRTSIANLQATADREMSFAVGSKTYQPTLWELTSFINNTNILGGARGFEVEQGTNYPNHAILVAKPNEPSLGRLVADVVDVDAPRERQVQQILDFVTKDIEYSHSEAIGSQETLKRPSEVLVTGSGDCSNKTVLTASLLHQLGEAVVLAYSDHHIAPAVLRGEFPADNGLTLEHDGKSLVLLETTLPGFEIGVTKLEDVEPIRWVQALDDEALVFDRSTNQALPFVR